MKPKKNSKLTSDFSPQIDEQCHRISFREIKVLWTLLSAGLPARLDFVRARFMQDALHFSDIMDFLTGLDVLRVKEGHISKQKRIGQTDDALKFTLAHRLFNRNTAVTRHIREFLRNFKNADERFEIVMDSQMRRRLGGARNLLLDLEVLEQDENQPRYWISSQYRTVFLKAINLTATSPTELQQILRDREKLGRAAELEVLKFESARLRKMPSLAKRIRHIAAEDVGAGFDISSFTEASSGTGYCERLIEVKAVPLGDFKFYWSRNEIEAARAHGPSYFLYLVPADQSGFNMRKLKIIQNPFKRLYSDHEAWSRQDELISFSLNHPSEQSNE